MKYDLFFRDRSVRVQFRKSLKTLKIVDLGLFFLGYKYKKGRMGDREWDFSQILLSQAVIPEVRRFWRPHMKEKGPAFWMRHQSLLWISWCFNLKLRFVCNNRNDFCYGKLFCKFWIDAMPLLFFLLLYETEEELSANLFLNFSPETKAISCSCFKYLSKNSSEHKIENIMEITQKNLHRSQYNKKLLLLQGDHQVWCKCAPPLKKNGRID